MISNALLPASPGHIAQPCTPVAFVPPCTSIANSNILNRHPGIANSNILNRHPGIANSNIREPANTLVSGFGYSPPQNDDNLRVTL